MLHADDVVAPRNIVANHFLYQVIRRSEADVQGRRCANRTLRVMARDRNLVRLGLGGDPTGFADAATMGDIRLNDGTATFFE